MKKLYMKYNIPCNIRSIIVKNNVYFFIIIIFYNCHEYSKCQCRVNFRMLTEIIFFVLIFITCYYYDVIANKSIKLTILNSMFCVVHKLNAFYD